MASCGFCGMLGYGKNLYVLPFDHRTSFVKKFIGDVEISKLSTSEKIKIKEYKKIIFQAYIKAVRRIRKKDLTAILIDDQFGLEIFKEAKKRGFLTIIAVEKSGQKTFSLEHGNNFSKILLKLKPDFVKALVYYHPAHRQTNQIQLKRLKRLDAFCKKNDYKLIVELLVPPSDNDLKKVKGKRELYDKKVRPNLVLRSIRELRRAGVEPDIWKLEAAEKSLQWEKIISLVKQGRQRREVGIIVLGRGENEKRVLRWLKIARQFKEINGFAVGRTVFIKPLAQYQNKEISRRKAIEKIANNYLGLVRLWET